MSVEKVIIQSIIDTYKKRAGLLRKTLNRPPAIVKAEALLATVDADTLNDQQMFNLIRCFLDHPVAKQRKTYGIFEIFRTPAVNERPATFDALLHIFHALRVVKTGVETDFDPLMLAGFVDGFLLLQSANFLNEPLFYAMISCRNPVAACGAVQACIDQQNLQPLEIAINVALLAQPQVLLEIPLVTDPPVLVNDALLPRAPLKLDDHQGVDADAQQVFLLDEADLYRPPSIMAKPQVPKAVVLLDAAPLPQPQLRLDNPQQDHPKSILENLPLPVWSLLAKFLTIRDLAWLTRTSKSIQALVESAFIWRNKAKQMFPHYQEFDFKRSAKASYKQIIEKLDVAAQGKAVITPSQLQSILACEEKFEQHTQEAGDVVLRIVEAISHQLILTTEPQICMVLNNLRYAKNLHRDNLLFAITLFHGSPRVLAWMQEHANAFTDDQLEALNFLQLSKDKQAASIRYFIAHSIVCTEELYLAIAATHHEYAQSEFANYVNMLSPFALDMLLMLNKSIAEQIIHSKRVIHLNRERLLAYITYRYAEYGQHSLLEPAILHLFGAQLVHLARANENFGMQLLSSNLRYQIESEHLAQLCLAAESYAIAILNDPLHLAKLSPSDLMTICLENIKMGEYLLQIKDLNRKFFSQDLRKLVLLHHEYAQIILGTDLALSLNSEDLLAVALASAEYAWDILDSNLNEQLHVSGLKTLAIQNVDYARAILNSEGMYDRLATDDVRDLIVRHEVLFFDLDENPKLLCHEWQLIMQARSQYLIYELMGLSQHLDQETLSLMVSQNAQSLKTYLTHAATAPNSLPISGDLLSKLCIMNLEMKEFIFSQEILTAYLSEENLRTILTDVKADTKLFDHADKLFEEVADNYDHGDEENIDWNGDGELARAVALSLSTTM